MIEHVHGPPDHQVPPIYHHSYHTEDHGHGEMDELNMSVVRGHLDLKREHVQGLPDTQVHPVHHSRHTVQAQHAQVQDVHYKHPRTDS